MLINKLREIRKEHHTTQLELADAVLTTRQTIHAIEAGRSLPGLELALRIADYFGLRVEDIFELRTQDKKGKPKIDPFTIF